jgi:hypothetical protein
MNSSVKSFVPIVTAGLPLPGCAEALLVLVVDEPPPPLVLVLLLLLLPHAAIANASVATSSGAAISRLVVFRTALPPPRCLNCFR